jgi:hypothetical protein
MRSNRACSLGAEFRRSGTGAVARDDGATVVMRDAREPDQQRRRDLRVVRSRALANGSHRRTSHAAG